VRREKKMGNREVTFLCRSTEKTRKGNGGYTAIFGGSQEGGGVLGGEHITGVSSSRTGGGRGEKGEKKRGRVKKKMREKGNILQLVGSR